MGKHRLPQPNTTRLTPRGIGELGGPVPVSLAGAVSIQRMGGEDGYTDQGEDHR